MTADFFDPFDDFPQAVAVPLEEAVRKFKDHWGQDFKQFNTDIRLMYQAGDGEARRAATEQWRLKTEEVQVQLFRSVMAAGSPA